MPPPPARAIPEARDVLGVCETIECSTPNLEYVIRNRSLHRPSIFLEVPVEPVGERLHVLLIPGQPCPAPSLTTSLASTPAPLA